MVARRCFTFLVSAPLLVLLQACSSVPPEGSARVEVALPAQAANLPESKPGSGIGSANLHAEEGVSINLLRITAPLAQHRHLESEEIVYVIAGGGVLHLAGGDRAIEAGDFVVIPRNTPHGFTPGGPEATVILQEFVPKYVDGDRIFEGAKR